MDWCVSVLRHNLKKRDLKTDISLLFITFSKLFSQALAIPVKFKPPPLPISGSKRSNDFLQIHLNHGELLSSKIF